VNKFKNGDVVFKTKDLREKRNNVGAYCGNAGKIDIMKRINTILGGEPVYNDVFIEQKMECFIEKNGAKIPKTSYNGIYKLGLCVILEVLLRYFNETNRDGKIWFFDLEETVINNIVGYKK